MLRKSGIFLLIALSVAGVASAQVAMLTQVSGEVRVASKDGDRAAVPFLKVNDGDQLTLTSSARVQLVYLATGRQEIWTGGGRVDIGPQEGRSPSLKAQTSQLPALILKQLAKTPAVGERGRTGMVMLRSLDDLAAAEQLEEDYAKFRASAAADDTTPEVFLLTSLLNFGEVDRAKKVLADLKARQALEPAYGPVVEHFSRLVAETGIGKKP